MILFEAWPPRPTGGQICGNTGTGVKGIHYFESEPPQASGIEATCISGRSQHKNKKIVEEMIEWALIEITA